MEKINTSEKIKKVFFWFMVPCFFFLHLTLGSFPIRSFSPTYDEPVHLTAGSVYWKTGDYRFNGYHHPAFGEMWAAIPIWFYKPLFPVGHPAWKSQKWIATDQYQFANTFVFKNRVSHERLMESGRWMQLLLSCLLGLCLFLVAWRMAGHWPALLALGLWAFSPTFLAHGTQVSTDLAFAFFFFSFFASVSLLRSYWRIVLSGISFGLCLGSKYFAIAFGPVLVALFFWEYVRNDQFRKEIFSRKSMGKMVLVLGISLLTLALIYKGTGLPVFWEGLRRIVSRSQAGRSSFFLGEHGTTGWFLYFPFLILTKTALPFLFGIILFIGQSVMNKKYRLPSTFILPPLVLLLITCVSNVQIGHRHVLGLYPFFVIWAAVAFARLPKAWGFLPLVFILAMGVTSWKSKPYFLSYFNSIVGGGENGYRYVTDSNVDWGQGLKELGARLSEEDKKKGIFFSYFGVSIPKVYGVKYVDVGSDQITRPRDDRDEEGINPTTFAVSLTNFQATYYPNKQIFDWLKEKEPIHKIAQSIFVYDFKNDPEALRQLYMLSGFEPKDNQ